MKRSLLLILLSLFSISAAAQFKGTHYSSLDDSELVVDMKNHIRFLSSAALEGRAPGSEGEKEAAVYLTQELEKAGVDIISASEGDVFGMKQESGDTLVSRNVMGYIQGYDKALRDHYIVIGARMDNLGVGGLTIDGVRTERIFYGANGNASGMAALIEIARKLATNSILLRRSVLIVGFGSSTFNFAGAWYFLNRSFADDASRIDAMINLDMLGTASNGFYACSASNPDMNAVADALFQTLQPIVPELVTNHPYPSDFIAFYDKEIPSMTFTTGTYKEHNTDKDTESIIEYEDLEREIEYIYNYTVAVINGPKPLFNASSELKKKQDDEGPAVVPYYDCDRRPSFLGHADPRVFLERWVYQYLKYPEGAVRDGIQGKVLVDFIINEKGKVTDVKVLRGVEQALDDEAVRVIKASPDWKPGYLKGKKVKSEISLWVEFRLEKRNKK